MMKENLIKGVQYDIILVLHSQTKPTMKEGSGQPTIVALVSSPDPSFVVG